MAAGRLSVLGRERAVELGQRRADDGIDVVFSSDLARAMDTTALAFGDALPVFHDWRLRECNYGSWNGAPRGVVLSDPLHYLDHPYPGGESWQQAVARVAGFLADVQRFWSHRRVLVVGHIATRWALEHLVNGVPLEVLAARQFQWRPGWEYQLPPAPAHP